MEATARDVEQHVPVPTLEREPIPEGDPLAEQHQEILGRLDRLDRILTSSAAVGGGGQSPVARGTPINWSELDVLGRLHQVHHVVARRSTMLLTPAEVVSKFGIPPEVGDSDGRLYFRYKRAGLDGTKGGGVMLFFFNDGYLIYHDIR